MIALEILPLRWADPKSRKLLIHDDTRPAERFAGDDGEGFYDARRAIAEWQGDTPLWWQSAYSRQLECGVSNLHLYGICQDEHSALYAVYIEHFSAPTDADDLFVETPLITLPDVVEDTPEAVYDPETHVWKVGDWFRVVSTRRPDKKFIAVNGDGPFEVAQTDSDGWIWTHPMTRWRDGWYFLADEIRPCPPPTQDSQSGPVCMTEPVPVHASPQQTLRGQEMPREHLGGLRPLD